MATVYGVDNSHYQYPGLAYDADKLIGQGYRFFIAKATQGARYQDPSYHDYRAEAERVGGLFAAYHFLTNESAEAQAENCVKFVTDASIPWMVDVEANGANLAIANAFRAAMKAKGRRVTLLYMPKWYWETLGKPSLRGWKVVSSVYPSSAHKVGSALYPGAKGEGWAVYGGVKPIIWQFASSGKVDGYAGNVDLDAFNGTLSSLRKRNLFKDYAPVKSAPKPAPTKAKPKPVDPVQALPASKKVTSLKHIDTDAKRKVLRRFAKNRGIPFAHKGQLIYALNHLRYAGNLGATGRAAFYAAMGWDKLFNKVCPKWAK